MNFQRDGLRRILSEKGLETEVLDNYDFQMWAKETWLLRSLWTKVGTTAYLSFALDPMEIRPEKEFVWAVSLYTEPPLYGVRDLFTMPLNHWENYLPDLLQTLEELRGAS